MIGRSVTVLAAGPLTTIQDRGRAGRAELGVGRSGAADRGAAALANRLVANPPGAALLEVTAGGLQLRADGPVTVALSGALAAATVDGRDASFGLPLPLGAGSVLRIGLPRRGLRTYVAVRGGVDVPPVLGSRSYDVLARLGPPPLRPGDVLPVGPDPKAWPHLDAPALPPRLPEGVVTLTAVAGPHLDALVPGAAVRLGEQPWTVGADSDRTGLRLTGAELALAAPSEAADRPPEGVVRGAVQVPPSGRPVVMMADHPVTGGYPAVAALDGGSADRAAQLRPGDVLRLRLVPATVRVLPRRQEGGRA